MTIYTFSTFNDPLANGSKGTIAFGINNSSQIVGSYSDSSLSAHGFLLSGSTYSTVDDPLATGFTQALGINSAGQIVGVYSTATGNHGFLYSPNGGTYTTLDDPLATNGTQAFGINDMGQIVGTYDTSTGTHAFIYSGGVFTTVDDPVNGNTLAHGINNSGQIV